MDTRQKSAVAVGVILILVGVLFALVNLVPELQPQVADLWPLIIIGVGVLLFVIGLITGAPDLAVPAYCKAVPRLGSAAVGEMDFEHKTGTRPTTDFG